MYNYTSYNDNFWACDFETLNKNSKYYKENNATKVYLAFAKKFNPKKEYDKNSDEILTVSIEEFFNQFWERKESATLFFHNLSWDGEFIKWYLQENGYKYFIADPKRKTCKGWTIIEDTGKIYFINVWKKVRDGDSTKIINLYIRCSYVILSIGIEALGKIYGSGSKQVINYDVDGWDNILQVPQHLIDYIKEDVIIMIQPLIQFNKEFQIERYFNNKKKITYGLSKLTASSTSLNLFKASIHNKYDFKKDFYLDYDEVIELTNWYNGGLTTYAPRFQYQETTGIDGHVYDVNSMYPAVMVENKYPIGKPLSYQKNSRYCICLQKIVIFEAKIKNKNWPALLKRPTITTYDYKKDYDGQLPRYVHYAKNATVWLFKDEFESLQRFYHFDYQIVEEKWFKGEYYFKDFILDNYNKRLNYKKNSDPREHTIKILLNSAYGKFGQKPDRPSIIYDEGEYEIGDVIVQDKEYVVETVREKSSCVGNLNCYIVLPKRENDKSINVAIAACVCKNARIKLHDAIYNNIESFIYCDTDSVFLTKPAKGIELNDNKLGAWKLEGKFDSAEVCGAKLYCLYLKGVLIKAAHAGINKKWAKTNLKKGDILVIDNTLPKGSKLMVEKVKGGAVIEETEFTIKKRS